MKTLIIAILITLSFSVFAKCDVQGKNISVGMTMLQVVGHCKLPDIRFSGEYNPGKNPTWDVWIYKHEGNRYFVIFDREVVSSIIVDKNS